MYEDQDGDEETFDNEESNQKIEKDSKQETSSISGNQPSTPTKGNLQSDVVKMQRLSNYLNHVPLYQQMEGILELSKSYGAQGTPLSHDSVI